MPDQEVVSAFTIASNNYLGMARTFVESYSHHHPGARVWVCVVDRPSPEIDYDDLPFEVVFAEDLGIGKYRNFAFRYDILELNTAVKPFVMKWLRDKVGLDRVFYFDPDILVMDRVTVLEQALESNLAVLTPHLTGPLDNECRPPERVIRMCGTYNLGFVGLRLNERTETFLDWWCDRLFAYCINDLPNGMFVDQSWMDLAPAYLDSVAIVRDPIFNVAYWNLPQRFPKQVDGEWTIDGRHIGFFHFSGLDLDDIDVISKHQDRVDLWSRPELRPLFEHYRDLVNSSGQNELRHIEYAYHRFSDSEIDIPRSVRKVIQEIDPEARRWSDPYRIDGPDPFLAWLARPIRVSGSWTSRMALALWRDRDDVRAFFPDPIGGDAADFSMWFAREGAVQSGIHPVLTADLRRRLKVDARNEERPDELNELSGPRAKVTVLNEPAEGDTLATPLITRLAMEIYHRRREVQELFPDPLGADRRRFAYWFVVYGRRLEALHPDLVRPVRDSLPLKTRIGLALKRVPVDGRPGLGLAAILSRPSGIRFDDVECDGVNLVGYFHDARGAASFASTVKEILSDAGVPDALFERDHELPDLMTSDSIRHPHGAPFPTTLLVLPSGEWKAAIDLLPLATRVGGRVVGFVTEAVGSLSPTALAVVDELWTPSEEAASELHERTGQRVRVVPLRMPWWTAMRDPGVSRPEDGKLWLGIAGDASGSGQNRDVSALLEGLRRLKPKDQKRIGVRLVAGAGNGNLVSELDHLPVEVVPMPGRPEVLLETLGWCDGWVNLEPTSRLAPVHLVAAAMGKPVIGLAPGHLTDVWNGKWMLSPSENAVDGATKLLTRLARLADATEFRSSIDLTPIVNEDEAAAAWLRAIRSVTD